MTADPSPGVMPNRQRARSQYQCCDTVGGARTRRSAAANAARVRTRWVSPPAPPAARCGLQGFPHQSRLGARRRFGVHLLHQTRQRFLADQAQTLGRLRTPTPGGAARARKNSVSFGRPAIATPCPDDTGGTGQLQEHGQADDRKAPRGDAVAQQHLQGSAQVVRENGLILEAHPDPKRHTGHQRFAVVVSTLEDELHAWTKMRLTRIVR